ncbi:MAG TPA: nucleotidyltransferase domain-containing protein [Candidatus Nanoarchaeia archaeon]|nr:nucleotidyltransferase domain-containing protein [Candidatus Nanoarchaeia archaeon]
MFKELNNLAYFFEYPNREFNIREIARLQKRSPATISKELKEYAKQEIIQLKKERNLLLCKANLDNSMFKELKKFYTLKKIRDSGIIEAINIFYLKPSIILFGSAAKGLDVEESDIDLAIISENNKEFPNTVLYEKKVNRKIHIFPLKKIQDLKNKYLVNNVMNGVIIQGEVQWT